MKKVVVASDSFKGSVSSLEVAESVEKAVYKVFPKCEVVKIPIADGGEGTMETLVYAMNGKMITCKVHNPLMNMISASYGILDDGKTAVIEVASASGLTLIPVNKRNPMKTTTYGTGELIKDALERGCTKFLIGLGGSATNDAGVGMLQALGFRFLNKEGKSVGTGGGILHEIVMIDCSCALSQLQNAEFTIACDVSNPFSGENGAAHMFARQKGADSFMIDTLDQGLKHFSLIIKRQLNMDIDNVPGAGAAGGLGGCFLAFLSASLEPGIEMVLNALHFEERIRGVDLIITGEGKLDKQTGMGKAPSGVLREAQKQKIPVIAIGGLVEGAEKLNQDGFLSVFSIQSGVMTLEKAMDKALTKENIECTVTQILRIIRYVYESNIEKSR